MPSNPLNIVEREWPDDYAQLKPLLETGIHNCIEAFKNTYSQITFRNAFECGLYCTIDYLIEYKDNTMPLYILPQSIVDTMLLIAIEIMKEKYTWFDDFHEETFIKTFRGAIFDPNIIQHTRRFMGNIDLNP